MVKSRFYKILLSLLIIAMISNNALAADRGLFGSYETKYSSFSLFPKWTSVLLRHQKDIRSRTEYCAPDVRACIPFQWHGFLDSIKSKAILQQLNDINRSINKHEYITDIVNWGISDYWETPHEFSIKDGDCEDFAIAKFKSLLYLGVRNDDMRIVVLQDLNLKVAHAVLVVYVDGQPYILDNQVEQVIPAKKIKHYMPIYSINETNWWRHS
jgi:predicted transglutaminase-like cysteine proteinase